MSQRIYISHNFPGDASAAAATHTVKAIGLDGTADTEEQSQKPGTLFDFYSFTYYLGNLGQFFLFPGLICRIRTQTAPISLKELMFMKSLEQCLAIHDQFAECYPNVS